MIFQPVGGSIVHDTLRWQGTVAVPSAYLPGAADFLLVDHIHNLICFYEDTIRNAESFIESGSFLIHTAPPAGDE